MRKQICEAGYEKALSEWPPHITIAAYENIDIHKLLRWTEEFSKKHTAFDIMFSSLGILPPGGEHSKTAVLYASPSQSIKLIDFYYAFHEELDEYSGSIGRWYSKAFGYPVIHSTIGIFEIAQLQNAMELIFENKIFGMAKIIALEVYTYPMQLIMRYELMM